MFRRFGFTGFGFESVANRRLTDRFPAYDTALDLLGNFTKIGGSIWPALTAAPGYTPTGTPTLGASGLELGTGDQVLLTIPSVIDQDFYLLVTGTFDGVPAGALEFAALLHNAAATSSLGSARQVGGPGTLATYYLDANADESVLSGNDVLAVAGRVAFVVGWQSGVIVPYSSVNSETAVAGATKTPAGRIDAYDRLRLGHSALPMFGKLEFVGLRYGTFNGAALAAVAKAA